MKIINNKIEFEKQEPAFRSCWECNAAHEHLKQVNTLHLCFSCGKRWVFDKFLESFYTEEQFIEWLNEKGVKEGMSTSDIDAGYRVVGITLNNETVKDRKPR